MGDLCYVLEPCCLDLIGAGLCVMNRIYYWVKHKESVISSILVIIAELRGTMFNL